MEKGEPARASVPQRAAAPVRADHQQLLALQGRAGNAAVVAYLGAQAKLDVGAVDDPLEHEADAVAARVVKQLADDPTTGDLAPAPAGGGIIGRVIRRRSTGAATIGAEGGEAGAEIADAIEGARGTGTPLAGDVRRSMEGAFGADFSDVRAHGDARAATLSEHLQARAFTHGSDIFFRDGVPDGRSPAGQHLLAHELAHTVQQGASGVARSFRRDENETQESEASETGSKAAPGPRTERSPEGEESETGESETAEAETGELETEEAETEEAAGGAIGEVVASGTLGTIELEDGEGEGVAGPPSGVMADRSAPTSRPMRVRTGPVDVRNRSTRSESVLGGAQDSIYSRTPRVANRARGGLVTTPFGAMSYSMRMSGPSWRVIRVRRDDYELALDFTIDADSQWGVNGGGNTDIPSGTSPAVTADNYQAISYDLWPQRVDASWVPPRRTVWSSALSERHERYHADEFHDWVYDQGAPMAKRYLCGQRIRLRRSEIDDPDLLDDTVEDLLYDAMRTVRDGYDYFFVAGRTYYNYPGEVRAYGDGKVPYETLSDAVYTEGRRLDDERLARQRNARSSGSGSRTGGSGSRSGGSGTRVRPDSE